MTYEELAEAILDMPQEYWGKSVRVYLNDWSKCFAILCFQTDNDDVIDTKQPYLVV